jgi:hypothetical protein
VNRTESAELAAIVKRRFRVMRAELEQRKAEAFAEFEAQMATSYEASDRRWAHIVARAKEAHQAAEDEIAKICADEGIPEKWAPSLRLSWWGRGENEVPKRRAELRKVAATRLEAQVRAGKLALERRETELLTDLAVGALESDEAQNFLRGIPSAAALVPGAALAEVEAEVLPEPRTLGT